MIFDLLMLLLTVVALVTCFVFGNYFFNYKPCVQSFVVLADRSKVPCPGTGCVSLILGDKKVIFHDVLHVPSLRCPLLSVWCLGRIRGCSFLGENSGCFLSFPSFILPVDDSSDCIIRGSLMLNTDDAIDFDSQLVGLVTAISDNTRFRSSRHPIQQPPIGTSQELSSQSPSMLLLPAITEVGFESSIPPPVPLDMLSPHILPGTTMLESVLESTSPPPHPTSLSDTQLKEIISLVTTNLRKHGKITPELLHALKG